MGVGSSWYTDNGLFLEGNGKGRFAPIIGIESRLYAPGGAKDMAPIRINGENHFMVAKNNDYPQLIKTNKSKR